MEDEDEMRSSLKTGKKVLILMDGNKHSFEAFEWYVEHIHKNTDIVVLAYSATHDGRPRRLSSSTPAEEDTEEESTEEQTKKFFRSIEELANRHRIRHILQLLHEPVGESVVKAAKQQNVDLIIAGSRQHGKSGHILGSTSTFITRFSHIPVMIYKYTDDTEEEKEHPHYSRSRSESFGEKIKARWKKENDHTRDNTRQRASSFSDRMKAIMKFN